MTVMGISYSVTGDVDVRVMRDFSIPMAIHDRIIRGFSILC